jgi:hypothetical protein
MCLLVMYSLLIGYKDNNTFENNKVDGKRSWLIGPLDVIIV